SATGTDRKARQGRPKPETLTAPRPSGRGLRIMFFSFRDSTQTRKAFNFLYVNGRAAERNKPGQSGLVSLGGSEIA
ncbi:hypothetical protein, partial [Citrobacter freundii]